MKMSRIIHAVNHVDDELVNRATQDARKPKRNTWMKWGSIAACFIVVLTAMVAMMPVLLDSDRPAIPSMDDTDNPIAPPVGETKNEYKYESGYCYQIDEGDYSTYVGGKIIAKDKIGHKIADVSITAGWKNDSNEWISATEKLGGEVYSINSVSDGVAVALKFIDQGEAVTTTHYYVIMNPAADLTPVKDYIIAPITPNNPGDEMVAE